MSRYRAQAWPIMLKPCFLPTAVLGKESQEPCGGTDPGELSWAPVGRGAPPATAALVLGVTWLSFLQQAPSWIVCQPRGGRRACLFLGASLSLRSQLARWALEGVFSPGFSLFGC